MKMLRCAIPVLLLLPFAASGQALFPGFVTEVLEPTGGSVARPVDWFHRERHGGSQFGWILSREDPDEGPYLVGVRIQLLADIERNTGLSGPEFVERFIAEKRRTVLVLSECDERKAGFFMRRCLETIEPAGFPAFVPFRVMHSLFYKDGHDLVGISIAGAPVYEWHLHTGTFDAMSHVQLIDMGRFE